MRWMGVLGVLSLALFAFGCGGAKVSEVGDDVLILELGGAHPPLLEQLRAARDKRVARELPPAPEPREPLATSVREPEPAPERAAPAVTKPARRVRLGAGQTLYRVATLHLDDGQRWRELLALNGWTEEQASHLPVGTLVALPE